MRWFFFYLLFFYISSLNRVRDQTIRVLIPERACYHICLCIYKYIHKHLYVHSFMSLYIRRWRFKWLHLHKISIKKTWSCILFSSENVLLFSRSFSWVHFSVYFYFIHTPVLSRNINIKFLFFILFWTHTIYGTRCNT